MRIAGPPTWPTAALWLLLVAGPVWAHDGHIHPPLPAPAERAPSGSVAPLPLDIGGPFALIDHTGAARSEQDFRGKHMLVAFGYTACPYTCGLMLNNIAGALDALGPAAERLHPLFVSVDPEHDTPARLAAHLAKFDPRLIGLTGSPDAIRRMLDAYRIEAVARDDSGAFERVIDHSSFVLLFGPEGGFLTLFPPITPPDRMAKLIRRYMDGAAKPS